jgi:hypothetical protein
MDAAQALGGAGADQVAAYVSDVRPESCFCFVSATRNWDAPRRQHRAHCAELAGAESLIAFTAE